MADSTETPPIRSEKEVLDTEAVRKETLQDDPAVGDLTFKELENGDRKDGASSGSSNELIVWWEEPEDQDPSNPMNWPDSKKWSIIGTLSLMTFLTSVLQSLLEDYS
jgi:hypothetical protein